MGREKERGDRREKGRKREGGKEKRVRRRGGERGLLQQNSPIKLAKFFQIIVSF